MEVLLNNKIKMIIVVSMISQASFADLSPSGSIIPSSTIKASDINTMLSNINISLANKGLSGRDFSEVQVGEPISSTKLVENRVLVPEIPMDSYLGQDVNSSELNSLFFSLKEQIDLLEFVSGLSWNVGYTIPYTKEHTPLSAEPTDTANKIPYTVKSVVTVSPGVNTSSTLPVPSAIGANGANSPIAVNSSIVQNSSSRFVFSSPVNGISVNESTINFLDKVSKSESVPRKYVSNGKIFNLRSHRIEQVAKLNEGNDLIGNVRKMGDHLYFTANSESGQQKLHRMDDQENIVRLTNINDGMSDSFGEFIFFNNKVYFTAGAYKYLYKIEDDHAVQISQGTFDMDSVSRMTVFNNKLYFRSRVNFNKLTTLDVNENIEIPHPLSTGQGDPTSLIVHAGNLYYGDMADGSSKLLRVSPAGAISRVTTATVRELPSSVKSDGSTLFFFINISSSQFETVLKLHKLYNGVVTRISGGNHSDIYTGNPNDNATPGVFYNGMYYVVMSDSTGKRKLFSSSVGATNNLQIVSNIDAGGYDDPKNLIIFNNELYFSANTQSQYGTIDKLFKVTSSGSVVRVSNTTNENFMADGIAEPFIFDNALFFKAMNPSGYIKLFRLDTDNKITQVSNIRPTGSDFNGESRFTEFNGSIYFAGDSSRSSLYKLTID